MRLLPMAWIACVAACASRPAVKVEGPLARLSFMTGCWRGTDGAGTVEERIGAADADIMLSTSRYLEGGRVTPSDRETPASRSSRIPATTIPSG